jgi:hypothetical protein
MNLKTSLPSFSLATRCLGSAFFVSALLADSYGRPVPQNLGNGLTGVSNAQHLVVTLSCVQDTSGGTFADVPARMDVLLGDVNAIGLVDGNDVSAVQGQTRNSVDATNFMFDVDLSGLIDGNDVSFTQSQTRSSLP